ncbi:MAG: hypothetical protein KJ041_03595, partial [Gammaproteobacteria bacterium]|nr:hypothetical protein [Gammaproteobacteria bacterium]
GRVIQTTVDVFANQSWFVHGGSFLNSWHRFRIQVRDLRAPNTCIDHFAAIEVRDAAEKLITRQGKAHFKKSNYYKDLMVLIRF